MCASADLVLCPAFFWKHLLQHLAPLHCLPNFQATGIALNWNVNQGYIFYRPKAHFLQSVKIKNDVIIHMYMSRGVTGASFIFTSRQWLQNSIGCHFNRLVLVSKDLATFKIGHSILSRSILYKPFWSEIVLLTTWHTRIGLHQNITKFSFVRLPPCLLTLQIQTKGYYWINVPKISIKLIFFKCFIVITISYGSDFLHGFDDNLKCKKKSWRHWSLLW